MNFQFYVFGLLFSIFNPLVQFWVEFLYFYRLNASKPSLTKNHDILTEEGWKPIAKVTKNDNIAV